MRTYARSKLRVCKLSKEEAEQFYEVHRGKPFYATLTSFMSSGRICAMELIAPGAIRKWRELLGPTDSNQVRKPATPCPAAAAASHGLGQGSPGPSWRGQGRGWGPLCLGVVVVRCQGQMVRSS